MAACGQRGFGLMYNIGLRGSTPYMCLSQGLRAVICEYPVLQVPFSQQGKTCETQPYLLIWEKRGGKDKGNEWWVQTQVLEVLVLGLKCRTTKVLCIDLWEEGESMGSRYTSTGRKLMIGICDFEVLDPS